MPTVNEKLIDELKRRGQLTPEVDAADERAKISEEGPSLGTINDPVPVQDPLQPAA